MMNGAVKTKILSRLRQIAGQVEGIARMLGGMGLEALTAVADAEDSAELVDMQRRFRLATALRLPLVPTSLGDRLPGQPISSLISIPTRVRLELAPATPVYIGPASPFFVRAVTSVRNRSLKRVRVDRARGDHDLSLQSVRGAPAQHLPTMVPLGVPRARVWQVVEHA